MMTQPYRTRYAAGSVPALLLFAAATFLCFLLPVPNAQAQTMSASANHLIMVCPDSTVLAAGRNSWVALGDGTETDQQSFVPVAGLDSVVAVATTYALSAALQQNGKVWIWGALEPITFPVGKYSAVPVHLNTLPPIQYLVGESRLYNENTQYAVNTTLGTKRLLAVDSAGGLWEIREYVGALAEVLPYYATNWPDWADQMPILQYWGAFPNLKSVTAGNGTFFVIDSSDSLWAWGSNDYGAMGIPGWSVNWGFIPEYHNTPQFVMEDVAEVHCGEHNTIVKKLDGSYLAMGKNQSGQLGKGDTSIPLAGPVSTLSGHDFEDIYAQFRSCVGVKADGTIWVWGNNSHGQLGLGDTQNRTSPVLLPGLTNPTDVAIGPKDIFIRAGSNYYASGDNQWGQWGQGNTVGDSNFVVLSYNCAMDAPCPVLPDQALTITQASCTDASMSILAQAQGGVVPYTYAWDDPANTTSALVTGLAAGTYHVTVTDITGCSTWRRVTVGGQVIDLDVTSTPNGCPQTNGTATATVSSGTLPYTYTWDANTGNQTTATATGLLGGIGYFVTVTDATGCTKSEEIFVAQDNSAVPTTQLRAQYCGSTLSSIGQIVKCDPVANANRYEWRVLNTGSNQTWMTPLSNPTTTWFSIASINGVSMGTTHQVQVRPAVGNCWAEWGPICTLTTPGGVVQSQLQSAYCGATVSSQWTYIYFTHIPLATRYRYELTDGAGYTATAYSPLSQPTSKKMYLGQFAGVQQNTAYTVRISGLVNGTWEPYGPSCGITWDPTAKAAWEEFAEPIALETQLVVFPNPTRGNMTVAMAGLGGAATNVTLRLHTITGKLLDQRQVQTIGADTQIPYDATNGLAPGMYLLEVRTPGFQRVERIVVQ